MRYTFLASFAATLLATTAYAQVGKMGVMHADANGDGKISRAEATAQANARFDQMDVNKDGVITPDERHGPGGRKMARPGNAAGMMQADGRPGPGGRMMGRPGGGMGLMRADTNGDGVITKAEATAQANARFDRMDANKDGKITADERRGPGDRMMARAGGDDGAMTRAEFLAQADKRFERIDANKDGKLSAEELKAWMEQARTMMSQRRADPADAIAPPAPATNPGK